MARNRSVKFMVLPWRRYSKYTWDDEIPILLERSFVPVSLSLPAGVLNRTPVILCLRFVADLHAIHRLQCLGVLTSAGGSSGRQFKLFIA
jgi:hypothetical protein